MPPKTRFTREKIRDTAYGIVQKQGAVNLTARSLAEELGVSTSPIFTAFSNMDEVLSSVRDRAICELDQKLSLSVWQAGSFKELGYGLLRFAQIDQNLFSVIFTGDTAESVPLSERLSQTKTNAVKLLMSDEGLSERDADTVFSHFLVFVLGLCFMGKLGDDSVVSMIDSEYRALISHIRQDRGSSDPVNDIQGSIDWKGSG